MRRLAVIRALEVISEASRSLPDDLKARHPQVDWRAVADAGNAYRHGYDSLDTAVHAIKPIATVAEAELEGVVGSESQRKS